MDGFLKNFLAKLVICTQKIYSRLVRRYDEWNEYDMVMLKSVHKILYGSPTAIAYIERDQSIPSLSPCKSL